MSSQPERANTGRNGPNDSLKNHFIIGGQSIQCVALKDSDLRKLLID